MSDAVRRLALASNDEKFGMAFIKGLDDSNQVLRIMNDLLSSHAKDEQKNRRGEGEDGSPNVSLSRRDLSTIYIKDLTPLLGYHKALASDYSLKSDALSLCLVNARVAHEHSRHDHARVFNTLRMAFKIPIIQDNLEDAFKYPVIVTSLAKLYVYSITLSLLFFRI